MNTSKPTITFNNPEQKALWDFELTGQLSDGFWENTKPYDHWRLLCSAETTVGRDYGRNFPVIKDNYNFVAKDLIDIVGDRMIGYVRLLNGLGYEALKDLHNRISCEGTFEMPTGTGEYWKTEKAKLAKYDIEKIKAALSNEAYYDRKKLMKDLKEIKQIIRTYTS
jgi:hypothetical protein